MTLRRRWGFAVLAMSLLSACSAGSPGPADQAEQGAAQPDAVADTVTVRRGDLRLEYTLDASTAGGTRVGLVPNARLRFVPADGPAPRQVRRGQRIGALRVTPAAMAALTTATGEGAASALANLRAQQRDVDAPIDGTLRQDGDAASIEAAGIDAVASLSPIQYLRYLSVPFSGTAHVETVLGPATVRCAALWSVPTAEASNDTAAELHCRLPSYVETAPGLRSTITVTSRTVKDALLVPNLYVGYDEQAEKYFLELARGQSTQRVFVHVGPSDGVVRVVRGEVAAGDRLARPAGGATQP